MSDMIRKMIKEEWRKNSTLYNGRSFLAFPAVIFFFSLTWNYLTVNLSSLSNFMIGNSLVAITGLLGIAVGFTGFSSRDAFENVLGRTNYLVYASKTLPVSRKRLYVDFFIKDTFFYLFLIIIPLSLGFMIPTGFEIAPRLLDAVTVFFFGLLFSSIIALSSVSIPSPDLVKYRSFHKLDPVSAKSVLDVLRSSGGFFKIVFSLGVLTFFYWFMILNFPLASIFLSNPLLSFSAILGLLNLSIYNWLNRFDSTETYGYLPEDIYSITHSKQMAFLLISLPTTYTLITASYLIYPGRYFLGLILGTSMTVYGLAVAVKVLGLEPNEKLYHADIFLKYLLGIGAILVPLLYLSVIFDNSYLIHLLVLAKIGFMIGIYNILQVWKR